MFFNRKEIEGLENQLRDRTEQYFTAANKVGYLETRVTELERILADKQDMLNTLYDLVDEEEWYALIRENPSGEAIKYYMQSRSIQPYHLLTNRNMVPKKPMTLQLAWLKMEARAKNHHATWNQVL